MKYVGIGCKINCWECNKVCPIKSIIKESLHNSIAERFFYVSVMQSLKASAGYSIAMGADVNIVNQEVKESAVCFYVARLKMLELEK